MVTLKEILGKKTNHTKTFIEQEQPKKEIWSQPAAEFSTPKISEQKYRRYFEKITEVTLTAATDDQLLYNQLFDYPSIIREIFLYTHSATDATAQETKIKIDDITVFDAQTFELTNSGGNFDEIAMEGAITGTITDNLAATATLTNVSYINDTLYAISKGSSEYLNGYFGTFGATEGTLRLKMDSYVNKKLEIYIDNKEAAATEKVKGFIITDKPIESKYSAKVVGGTWSV